MEPNPRRRRLVAYFEQMLEGDRARLQEQSGLTQGRVSQLFSEGQPFGELAARKLAERLGLPPDYFEHDPPGMAPAEAGKPGPIGMAVSELERDVLLALRALPPAERLRVAAGVIGQAETLRYIQRHAEPEQQPPEKRVENDPPQADPRREQVELQARADRAQQQLASMRLLTDQPVDDRTRDRSPPVPHVQTTWRRQ